METHCKKAHTMDQLWEEASARFLKRTGESLDLKPARTLEDCVREIDARQLNSEPDQNDASDRVKQAKESGRNILQCFKLLGGVAAEGTAMVFAPSKLCFNALSLLLDIPEKMHSFHESIDGLFEALWPSLSNFRIYGNIEQFVHIEPELMQAIQNLMISFIDICALSIEFRNSGKWLKFKMGMKYVLLQNDSGVKKEIERFQKLTEDHTSIQGTQTLKLVLESRSDIIDILYRASETGEKIDKIAGMMTRLKAAGDKREATEGRNGRLDTIRKKLNLEDNKEISKSAKIGDVLWKKCVPGTADWFKDQIKHPEFAQWADSSHSEVKPVLLVNGDQNTGKSVLLSAIARSLRSVYESSERSSARTCVAVYFFPSSTGKEDDEKQPIEMAMKCIAYLLAEQDKIYANNLSQALDTKSDPERYLKDAKPSELWDFLMIGSPKNKSTHYVVIDGVGGLSETFHEARGEFFRILALSMNRQDHQPNQSRVRAAISVRPTTPITPLRDLYSKIDIEEYNHGDILKFIDYHLKDKDLFQEPDDNAVRIRERVRDTLTKEAKGSFTKVNAAIDQIDNVVNADGVESDVERILIDFGKDKRTISKTVVRQLREDLTAEGIKELNELLIWVIYGKKSFQVKELEAALFLRFKKWPMLRLMKKLEERYKPLITLEMDGFAIVADGMIDSIKKVRTERREVNESPKFTATITITKGDLSSVQRFLWSLTQKFDHDSLGFRQLADQGGMKGDIGVDEYDSHLAIVRSTFNLLKEPPNERTKAISVYLLYWLPDHLEELQHASGINELTDAEKTEIGDGIYEIFLDNVLETHWKSCYYDFWYGQAKKVIIFRRWLSDATAISQLGRLDREWLREVEAHANPNQALLARVMKFVAKRWLRDTEWQVRKPFRWLRDYFAMPTTPLRPPIGWESDNQQGGDFTIKTAPAKLIEDVATQCKKLLEDNTEDALWHQRLGETFWEFKHYEDGVKAFNKAIELGGSEILCFQGLAHCFAGDDKLSDACTQMEKTLVIMEKEDPPCPSKITETYFTLAKWYGKLRKADRVIDYTKKVIERVTEDGDLRFKALQRYLEIDQESQDSQLLQDLLGLGGDQMQLSPTLHGIIGRMESAGTYGSLRSPPRENLFLPCFRLLQGNVDAFVGFICGIDKIIESRETEADMVTLLLYKGVGLHYFSHEAATDALAHQSALVAWQQCLDKSSEHSLEQEQAAMFLSAHHFEHARGMEKLDSHRQDHIDGMSRLTSYISAPRSYLASYHMETGDQATARKVLRASIETAFNQLSDDIEENDAFAYYKLGSILTHLGDDVNARTAFSLLLPRPSNIDIMAYLLEFEQESTISACARLMMMLRDQIPPQHSPQIQIKKALQILDNLQSESMTKAGSIDDANDDYRTIREELQKWSDKRYLMGETPCNNCLTELGSSMDFYHCRYCYDMDICNNCWVKLHDGELLSGSLSSLTCKPSHGFLRLPKRNRTDLLRSFSGHVIKGGNMDGDGRRLGGEEVPTQVWLDGLKREWGFADKQ